MDTINDVLPRIAGQPAADKGAAEPRPATSDLRYEWQHALARSDLTMAHKAVEFLRFAHCDYKTGTRSRVSQAQLAAELGCARRTVREADEAAMAAGLMREGRGGFEFILPAAPTDIICQQGGTSTHAGGGTSTHEGGTSTHADGVNVPGGGTSRTETVRECSTIRRRPHEPKASEVIRGKNNSSSSSSPGGSYSSSSSGKGSSATSSAGDPQTLEVVNTYLEISNDTTNDLDKLTSRFAALAADLDLRCTGYPLEKILSLVVFRLADQDRLFTTDTRKLENVKNWAVSTLSGMQRHALDTQTTDEQSPDELATRRAAKDGARTQPIRNVRRRRVTDAERAELAAERAEEASLEAQREAKLEAQRAKREMREAEEMEMTPEEYRDYKERRAQNRAERAAEEEADRKFRMAVSREAQMMVANGWGE